MGFINKNIVEEQISENFKDMYLTNVLFHNSINFLEQNEMIDSVTLITLIANLCSIIEQEQNELTKYSIKYGQIE